MQGRSVKLLVLFKHSIDQIEQAVIHGRVYAEFTSEILRLSRRFAQLWSAETNL